MSLVIVVIILILSLLITGLIVVRKFPQLVSTDTNQIPAERYKQVKSQIIEQRVSRRIKGWVGAMVGLVGPFIRALSVKINRWYHQIIRLEKYYRERSLKAKFIKEQSAGIVDQNTADKLKRADEFLTQDKLIEAESLYIDVISKDPKNLQAYEGLAQVYCDQKNYDYSVKTFEHILKIDPLNAQARSGLAKIALDRDLLDEAQNGFEKAIQLPGAKIEDYINLGKIYEKTQRLDKALGVYQLASRVEPKSPRVLDLLLEACILNKKRVMAKNTLNKLKKVNPDNQKLDEFKKRIDEIV